MVRVAARSSRAGSWEPTPRREVSGFPPHSTCGMRVRPSCHVRGSGASLRVWRPSDQGWWRQWLRELLGVELSWGTGLMAYAIGHPLFPAAWTEIKLRSRLWVPNLSRGVPRIVIVLGSPTLNRPLDVIPTRSSCRGARFVRSVATSSGRSDTTSPRSPCQPQATSTRPSPVSPCRCPASAWSPTRCSCGGSGLEPCEHSCRREGSRQRSSYPWWLQFVHSQPSHVQVSHAQSGPHFVHWQSPACAKEMSESVCVSVVMAYHYPVLHEGTLVTRGGQG